MEQSEGDEVNFNFGRPADMELLIRNDNIKSIIRKGRLWCQVGEGREPSL